MTFSAVAIQSMIRTRGQVVTLRRPGDSPPLDVDCLAKIDGAEPRPLSGNRVQFQRRVIISDAEIQAAAWPGPPQRLDQVLIDGDTMTVQAVDTANIGAGDVMHVLTTLGG